jgi:hypothetical protein
MHEGSSAYKTARNSRPSLQAKQSCPCSPHLCSGPVRPSRPVSATGSGPRTCACRHPCPLPLRTHALSAQRRWMRVCTHLRASSPRHAQTIYLLPSSVTYQELASSSRHHFAAPTLAWQRYVNVWGASRRMHPVHGYASAGSGRHSRRQPDRTMRCPLENNPKVLCAPAWFSSSEPGHVRTTMYARQLAFRCIACEPCVGTKYSLAKNKTHPA